MQGDLYGRVQGRRKEAANTVKLTGGCGMTERCRLDACRSANGVWLTLRDVTLAGLFCCCQLSDRKENANDASGYKPPARFRRDCQWKIWGPWPWPWPPGGPCKFDVLCNHSDITKILLTCIHMSSLRKTTTTTTFSTLFGSTQCSSLRSRDMCIKAVKSFKTVQAIERP